MLSSPSHSTSQSLIAASGTSDRSVSKPIEFGVILGLACIGLGWAVS